jgi:hypothetical protein
MVICPAVSWWRRPASGSLAAGFEAGAVIELELGTRTDISEKAKFRGFKVARFQRKAAVPSNPDCDDLSNFETLKL